MLPINEDNKVPDTRILNEEEVGLSEGTFDCSQERRHTGGRGRTGEKERDGKVNRNGVPEVPPKTSLSITERREPVPSDLPCI